MDAITVKYKAVRPRRDPSWALFDLVRFVTAILIIIYLPKIIGPAAAWLVTTIANLLGISY